MSSGLSMYTLYLEKWRRSVPAGWGAVDSSGEAAQPLWDMERLAHTLAGTAGTLGFHETGADARVLKLPDQDGMALILALRRRRKGRFALTTSCFRFPTGSTNQLMKTC